MCCSGRNGSHGRESPQTVYVRVCGWRKIDSSLTSNERRTGATISARADKARVFAGVKSGPRAAAEIPGISY